MSRLSYAGRLSAAGWAFYSNYRFEGSEIGTRNVPISPAAAPPAGNNPQFKLAGAFGYRPMAIKLSGTFTEKPLLVKAGGVFV